MSLCARLDVARSLPGIRPLLVRAEIYCLRRIMATIDCKSQSLAKFFGRSNLIYIWHPMWHTIFQYPANTKHKSSVCYILTMIAYHRAQLSCSQWITCTTCGVCVRCVSENNIHRICELSQIKANSLLSCMFRQSRFEFFRFRFGQTSSSLQR